MNRILPVLLGWLLWAAPATVKAQLTYITNAGAITITGYSAPGGPVGLLTLPASTNGLPVTSIADDAFDFSTNLTSVTIPGSITNIGNLAFYDCSGLTSLTISDGVSNIGAAAFEFCGKLAGATIPGSVTSIGAYAFGVCDGLTNVTISNGVTNIGVSAFEYCSSLAGVSLPESVISIGEFAFFGCSNMAGAVISNGAANLGDSVFNFCTSLGSITLPGALTNAGGASAVLYGCTNLTMVTISDGSPSVADGAFAYYFTNLTRVTIPDGVASIGKVAFEECTGLTSLSLPGSVATIGEYAFFGCSNLATVTISNGAVNIGNYAFVYCARLTGLTLLGSVTTLGEYAFFGCSNLTGVEILGGVGSLGYAAFANCVNLTSVVLGGNAPATNSFVFSSDYKSIIYYLPGTTGWSSPFASRQAIVQKKPFDLLFVLANGNGVGTITPNYSGKLLTPGNNYTVTAVAASRDYIFDNWTGGANTGSSYILSTNAIYKFVMESNLTLQANFIPNVFIGAQGNYRGLFNDTNDLTRQQTHSGSFTLNVTSTGSFTGDLYLGSTTPIAMSGKFTPGATAAITAKRNGGSPLTVILTLFTNNQTVTGAVSDGSFNAALLGYQNVFNSANKAAKYEGQYTLVIPGSDQASNGPFGTSYGTVTVSALGTITFAGSLADGTSVSQSSIVGKNGAWPLYLTLYGGHGSFYSWNYFTNDVSNGILTFATNASWINAGNSAATAAYKQGFTNDAVVIYGSPYTPVALNLPGGLGQVVLDGGDLMSASSLTNYISLGSNDKITVTTNANKMVLTVNKTSGVISGSFANDLKTIKISGVLFQSQTNAQGYFLGPDQTSGAFLLEAQ